MIFACTIAVSADAGQLRRRGPVFPRPRASFAFHYQPVLTADALAWYSRFEILVTHDPLPRDQVDQLHAAGTKLLLYEWSVAFYESRATSWQRSLLENSDAVLNAAPLTGWAGSDDSPAWYFDPASGEHEVRRAADLAQRLEDTGYDGVFFDTTTVASVHPTARAEYERRHPDTPYDVAFSRFLRQLRTQAPRMVLFTNQGYRSAEHYLPYADWDLTESLITRATDGAHRLRSWHDADDPWSSIRFVMQNMIEPVASRYPKVRFGHLNYISSTDPESIRVVVAAAQLFGGDGYVAAGTVGEEIDPIYFRSRGVAQLERVETADGRAMWRFFDNGLVVVSAATEPVIIPNTAKKGLRNHLTGELACGGEIVIPPVREGARAFFFDYSDDCR